MQPLTGSLVRVSDSQFYDGFNAFYSDFRNRNILTMHAAYVVVIQVAGKPQPFIDSIIETLRRCTAEAP